MEYDWNKKNQMENQATQIKSLQQQLQTMQNQIISTEVIQKIQMTPNTQGGYLNVIGKQQVRSP